MTNREVCKAFFNFNYSLNKGYGITTSIYALINRSKDRNSQYFQYLEDRIRKEAISCKTLDSFLDLLRLTWSNLPDGCEKWSTVAHVFFVTDIVDSLCRSTLLPFEYNIFRSHAEQQLCRTLELRYGNSLTTYAWDVFNMKEKTIALKPKIPTFIAKLLLYSFVAFSAYQIV